MASSTDSPFDVNAGADRLGKLSKLLERSGIDVADISRVERVNVWQGFLKNPDGEAEIVDLAGISLVPRWAEGPAWPVVAPGPVVKVPAGTVSSRAESSGAAVTVVWPDVQVGFWRGPDDALVACHDETAIDVAFAVTKAAKPDVVVMVGDTLDLPEMSRYRTSPAFARTTQASIDRATLLVAQIRQAAPDARIVWIAGNHEERLSNWITDNAKAAFGLRRGGLVPESWPVLSVPHLCRLDEYGCTYLPGYPANEWWVNDRLRIIHGHRVNSRGSTATYYLNDERVSTIYGHVHRREWSERTRTTRSGPRTILAASPGTLARVDGAVPSVHQGIDLDGRPIPGHEDWQQGLAVITADEGDSPFHLELVSIFDGSAFWRGRIFATGV